MLIQRDGVSWKLICPSCRGDNIGESGLGGKFVHCFGHCMMDILKSECPTQMVETEEEVAVLEKPAY